MQFKAHYKSGRSVVAEVEKPGWSLDDAGDPTVALTVALDGVFALLSGYAEPLTAELEVRCFGPDFFLRFHEGSGAASYLRRRDLPAELRPRPTIRCGDKDTFGEVERLERSTLLDWASRAVAASRCSEPDHRVDWSEFGFLHHAVRLPVEATDIRDGELYVRRDLGAREEYTHAPVRIHQDGSTWVYVPHWDNFDAEPFEVTLYNDCERVVLIISVGWTVWSKPSSPGYRDIAAGLERLVALGWTIDENGVLADA